MFVLLVDAADKRRLMLEKKDDEDSFGFEGT
jgi:hypothetical protein